MSGLKLPLKPTPQPHGYPWVRTLRWLLIPLLALAMSPLWSAGGGLANNQGVTLNLKDADIEAVINTVAEITGKNFIVDPRVKGKVTIISTQPLDKDAIYQVFLSVLDVHGFAAVPGKGIIKIVPNATAKQSSIPTITGNSGPFGDELVTRVVAIRNVAAAQLVPILRPLVAQQGHLAAYPPSNMLIVADRASNIDRIVHLIRRIDQPTQGDIEFIPLQHASASEVVRVLTSLTQNRPQDKAGRRTTLVADERTNSVLVGGDRDQRLRLRAIITHLDTPADRGGNTQVIYLRYAKASELAPVLTGIKDLTGAKDKKVQAPKGEVSIQADESTNALVITAPPDQMRALKEVIRKLDIRRAQVLIEAIIAEVSMARSAELGVQWILDASRNAGAVGMVNFGAFNPVPEAIDNIANALNPNALGTGLALGVGSFTGSVRFAAIIKALAGDSTTNILSMPNLITMDNEEAEIVVGKNVPFITGQFTTNVDTGGTSTNPFQTIERQDVGLTLKVKPQINEGNAVKLEISQEVSSIASATLIASDIVTNKRSVKTVVMADDGGIVVIGGLMEDNIRENKQKVPLLGDIPLIGQLFRTQSSDLDKTTLMIFIHPTIMRSQADNTRIANSKYNYVRTQQLDQRMRGVGLMPAHQKPVLPTLDKYLELPPPFEESREQSETLIDLRSGKQPPAK